MGDGGMKAQGKSPGWNPFAPMVDLLSGGQQEGQDFRGAAEAAAAASRENVREQTQANRPNQQTPFGQSQWVQNPDGSWSQSVGFSDPLNQLGGSLANQAASFMQTPMDWSQFGAIDDGSAARQQAIDAAYAQATSRLDPQWAQREEASRTQLLNQGLDPESQAYKNAKQQEGFQRNDAYGSAMNAAIGQGREAGESVFRQNMMKRQQAIAEALQRRGMPMSEIQQMMGMLQMPGFTGAGQAQAPNYLAAAGMQDNADWRQQMLQYQMWADMMNAGGDAAGTVFSFSDERLKDDVERLPVEAMPGVPFASWTWKGDTSGARYVGVIAQDVEKVLPDRVRTHHSGFKQVDYRFLFEVTP